jgi:hypothetical protein
MVRDSSVLDHLEFQNSFPSFAEGSDAAFDPPDQSSPPGFDLSSNEIVESHLSELVFSLR